MFSFVFTAWKSSGNLPEGVGAAQLAKEHGFKFPPAGKSSGMSLGPSFLYVLQELGLAEKL